MSVCAEHLSNDNAATTVQPSAPQLGTLSPPQNLSSVDATSLQNLLNAGGLANPTPHKESSDEENIVQLEGSPYLHKRRMDSKLSSPSQEQIKASGSASLGDQTATASRPNSSTEEQATFKVHMATHRLMNMCHPDKPQLFKVEVSHSRALLLSAVHVYSACDVMPWTFDETGPEFPTPEQKKEVSELRLVALAHTLDPNTLPSPQMLKMTNTKWETSHIAMCDWDAGERAMIVKGAGGKDWAIVIARWTGLRRGVPGTHFRRGVPGNCGELSLRLHCPVNSPAEQISLPYSKSKFDFQVRSCWIDLHNGTVLVKGEEEQFVEHITLGFAITVLHVLCQPRMDNVDTTDSSPAVTNDLPNRIPVERLSLLTAAGFFCLLSPTNQYRRQMSQAAVEAGRYKRPRRFGTVGCDYPLLLPMMTAAYDAGDAIQEAGQNVGGSEGDGFMGACGACGGCGGCGGGVASMLGQRPKYLWGNSQSGTDNHDGCDLNGDDGGFDGFDGGCTSVVGHDAGSWVGGNSGGNDSSLFSALFGGGTSNTGGVSGGADGGGGGDGDGGCGGCGGGCGGCGGCGC
ncbi:hypothetical protein FHG87_017846 [Trinorchestia longiramus]|nr:hypothetical protein FHG87_017846 [Trinorchestia longiramus]